MRRETGTARSRPKGYQPTTVDEIVEEVGIYQRTFFRYFDSKGSGPVRGLSVQADLRDKEQADGLDQKVRDVS